MKKLWSFQESGLSKTIRLLLKLDRKDFITAIESMGTRTGGLWLQRDTFGCQVDKGWGYDS